MFFLSRSLLASFGLALVAQEVLGFLPPLPQAPVNIRAKHVTYATTPKYNQEGSFNPIPSLAKDNKLQASPAGVLGALAPLVLIPAQDALAKGGEYGVLEGRSFAFIHPISMGILFLLTAYSGYLGWQWRTVRTLATEINDLKATFPVLSDGLRASSPVSKQITALQSQIQGLEADANAAQKVELLRKDIATLQSSAVAAIDATIVEMTETRKKLLAGDFRDKHYTTGAILLGGGVTVSILGCFDTYFRAGKLFPGPHLFAGAGITVLWALAASLIPYMQKGQDWARTLHIAFNAANLLLFTWQVGTGIEIALKVWELTKWP